MRSTGFWSKVPPKPVSQRWLYIMQAAKHFLDLCEKPLPIPYVGFLFPQGFEQIVNRATKTVKDAALRLVARGQDPRIRVAIVFEFEFGKEFQQPEMTFHRAKSFNGWDVGFRTFDIREHFEEYTISWWNKSDDYKTILPLTHAAVEALEKSEDRDQFRRFVQDGVNEGREKFSELFSFMNSIDHWYFDITARGRSGSCWRAATSALRQRSPASFPVPAFTSYDANIPLDKTLFDRFNTPENLEKLHDFFISWGFYDDEILHDIEVMTKNQIVNPDDDTVTCDFVRGVSDCTALFDRCKRTFGACPTTNLMNELTFSQMKALHEPGQSDEALDQHLAYRQNIMHALNLERRELIKHRKDSTKAADSPEQLLLDIQQFSQTILPRYTAENMRDTPARSTFQGHLTRTTDENAARFVDRKPTSHYTREDFDDRYKDAQGQPTHGQKQDAIISAVTNEQRLRAVIHEESVPGQVGIKRSFWGNLNASQLKNEIKLLSPFLYSFLYSRKNKSKTMIEKVAWVRKWAIVMRRTCLIYICNFLSIRKEKHVEDESRDEKSNFLFVFGFATSRKASAIHAIAAERKGSTL